MLESSYDLETDGFTILRKVFPEEVFAPVRDLLREVVRFAETSREDPFTRYYLPHRADQGVLYDLFQRHPQFEQLARNEHILDALETVLGPDIFMYENSVVYKPKGKQNGVPFHQDFISRQNEPRKYIGWMALEPVTADGGALKVIPGSHQDGFLPWHRVHGETHHDRIDPKLVDGKEQVKVLLDPGDVLIFNQLIVHGSDEAHTDSLRLVYRVSYQGFEEIKVPRGSPIVLRGGEPASLAQRYVAPARPRTFLNRAVTRIGERIADFGHRL